MNNIKLIKKQIDEFRNDPEKKEIEIQLPKGFRMRYLFNPIALTYRKCIMKAQYFIPPSGFKNWLLRTCGMNMEHDVCMSHFLSPDHYFPCLVTIRKGALIGGMTKFMPYKIEEGKLILGRIEIGERTLVAGMTYLYPGVKIGKQSMTGAGAHITKDVPDNSFVIKKDVILKQWNDDELELYFGESSHDPKYYKDFRKKINKFIKNRKEKKIRIKYNGKRLNAADDWYKARSLIKILFNSAIVVLTYLTPFNAGRIFLYKFMGVKFGKNVKVERGATLDPFFGERHNIGSNVLIKKGAYIDSHSYTIAESIFGGVKIGDNTVVEEDASVMCGLEVGKNCIIKKGSLIIKDVPDGETWKGVPAKKVEEEQND